MDQQTPVPAANGQIKSNGNGIWKAIGSFIVIFIAISVFTKGLGLFGDSFETSYYVAKYPSYSAASVKIDGYMHKDKSCCQKVADFFGAEVIKVKPSQEAGKNTYGQTLTYDDCFYYCSLCCY